MRTTNNSYHFQRYQRLIENVLMRCSLNPSFQSRQLVLKLDPLGRVPITASSLLSKHELSSLLCVVPQVQSLFLTLFIYIGFNHALPVFFLPFLNFFLFHFSYILSLSTHTHTFASPNPSSFYPFLSIPCACIISLYICLSPPPLSLYLSFLLSTMFYLLPLPFFSFPPTFLLL